MKEPRKSKWNLIWAIPVTIISIFFIVKLQENTYKPKLEYDLLSVNKIDSITIYITKSKAPNLVETYILKENTYKHIGNYPVDSSKAYVLDKSIKEITKYNKFK